MKKFLLLIAILFNNDCFAIPMSCSQIHDKWTFNSFFSECVTKDNTSNGAMALVEWAYYLDKNPNGFEKLLTKLAPRMKKEDILYAQYLNSLVIQDGKKDMFLREAARAGSIEGAYDLYKMERKFPELLKSYKAGYPPAIFDYALAVKNGNYGLKRDLKKAAMLMHQAALKGESSAVPSIPEYFSLLPEDEVEFWKAMMYLQLIPNAPADSVKVTHWSAFCKNFAQADALFWALPESVDMTRQQQEFLVEIAINCSP